MGLLEAREGLDAGPVHVRAVRVDEGERRRPVVWRQLVQYARDGLITVAGDDAEIPAGIVRFEGGPQTAGVGLDLEEPQAGKRGVLRSEGDPSRAIEVLVRQSVAILRLPTEESR